MAVMLNYGEPQISEVFKKPLFPIEHLRQAVQTAQRICIKEILDR